MRTRYVMTQSDAESVAGFLSEKLAPSLKVACYHGGLSMGAREDAHVAFLNGQVQVVVATVAFGMGIDKPDVRRIIHYGPPKTVEEYFQQIGRAGRDGLDSVCELISSDSDFRQYSSDFYTKNLSEENIKHVTASTEALRNFASCSSCRWRWLLEYFGETPSYRPFVPAQQLCCLPLCRCNYRTVADIRHPFKIPRSLRPL